MPFSLQRRTLLSLPWALALGALPVVAAPLDWRRMPLRLLMAERRGCIHCAAWHRQIGPGYATSRAGRRAPLLRVDLDGLWPDGLALASHPFVTPTFILLDRGLERGRIEGYPGADGFYPRMAHLLHQPSHQSG